jgi:hypothetical protein
MPRQLCQKRVVPHGILTVLTGPLGQVQHCIVGFGSGCATG